MSANFDVDSQDGDVPVALLAGRTPWQTTRPQRTVLVVVHNVTAATSSSPGQAAPLLRSAIYRLLELDEPVDQVRKQAARPSRLSGIPAGL